MPLDKQNVPLPFGQGLDTKNDPKQLAPGKLTVLQNGVFQVGKEIKKRNGYTALSKNISGGGTISSGVGITDYLDELVELDGSTLYSYNAGSTNWVNKGTLVNTRLSVTSVIRNNTQQTIQDSAINGSFRCFVWYDTVGQLGYSVFDTSTNQSIVNNQPIDANGIKVKVLALGSYFVIIYFENVTNKIKYRAINIATPTSIAAAVDLATDVNVSNYAFDATVFNSRIYLAYGSTTSHRVSMYYLDSSLVRSTQLNVAGSLDAYSITVFGDASNNAWVGYSGNGLGDHVYAFIANANLSSTVVASTSLDAPTGSGARNITGVVSGTVATYYYECVTTSGFVSHELTPNRVLQNTFTLSGTAGSSSTLSRGVGLGSKVIAYNGVNYMIVAYQSTLQSSYFLMNGSGIVVAKLSSDSGGGYTTNPILPEMNAVSSGVYQTASLIKDLLFSADGNTFTQTGVLSATFTFSAAAPPKFTLGQNLHVGGGIIEMYDGASVVEHGYSIYPEGLLSTFSATAATTGGGIGLGTASTTVNQLQYVAVYEWTDNEGQIHRSAPSIPVTVNLPKPNITIVSGSTHGSSTILTGAVGTTATVGQYINVIGFSNSGGGQPFLNWTYNGTVSAVSGGTVTVGSYNIAATTEQFVLSDLPLTLYFLLTPAYGTKGTPVAGQLLIPLGDNSGTNSVSYFPPGTYVTDVTTGATSSPTIGNVNGALIYYSADVFQVAVTIPCLQLTTKNKVAIVLYRTEVNGTQFYRTTSPTSLTYNDKTVDSITITDATPDLKLIGNEQLYTTGEIENIEAPAIRAACTYRSRAIVVPSEADVSWWFSKQVIPGSPVEFTDSFVKNIDSKIGKLQCVGVLDEKLILFGATSKYYVVGDGPGASGANDDFSSAQHITGSTGCSNPSSLLEIPIGLIYQDPTKGIYLLDRSLQEVYIGQEVERYNADPITSAQTIPGTTSIRFTMTSGAVLVYDWFYQQWGADPYLSEAISSTLSSSEFTYVQANGLVLQETAGTFTDNGTAITLRATTGWIPFAGVQGFQRVYELLILGNYKSPHTLNVVIYSNNDDVTPTQTVAIPVTSDPTNYEYRIRIIKQKCTSIKIDIYDSNQSGTGESLSLSSMGFVVGVKKGQNKLSAEKSY